MSILSFPIGRGWADGVLDAVQIDPSGIIRLLGWRKSKGDVVGSMPAVLANQKEVPFLQSFRYARHDVPADLAAGVSQTGVVLEYLVPESAASQVTELTVNLGGGTKPLQFKTNIQFIQPHYRPLLNTETVFHRADIYGSGPPNSAVHPQVLELAKLLKPPVLDFGCGRGALTHALRRQGIEAYGLEMDTPMIREAIAGDASGIITLYDGSFPSPYRAGQFRSVICSEVLEHIPNYEAALAEMARVSTDMAIYTVPDASAIPLGFRHGVVPWHLLEGTHVNFFTQQSLRKALEKHFKQIEFGRVGLTQVNGSPYYVSLAAVCWR